MQHHTTFYTQRIWHESGLARLCLLGVHLRCKGFFKPLQAHLKIGQKVLTYTPVQKLEMFLSTRSWRPPLCALGRSWRQMACSHWVRSMPVLTSEAYWCSSLLVSGIFNTNFVVSFPFFEEWQALKQEQVT